MWYYQNSKTLHRQAIDTLFSAAFQGGRARFDMLSLNGWRMSNGPATRLTGFVASGTAGGSEKFGARPDVQIRETATRLIIEVTLPALDRESLYIEVSGNMLIIRGEALDSAATMNRRRHDVRQANRYQRFVKLPDTARPGDVHARLKGNVVHLDICKRR